MRLSEKEKAAIENILRYIGDLKGKGRVIFAELEDHEIKELTSLIIISHGKTYLREIYKDGEIPNLLAGLLDKSEKDESKMINMIKKKSINYALNEIKKIFPDKVVK